MPHDTLTVARDPDDAYVGRCDCGWTTSPSATGAQIGEEWDRHRRGAVAGGTCQVQVH